MYYDIHSHLFNKDFVAKELLYRLLLELRKFLSGDEEEDDALRANAKGILQTIRRINSFLRVGFKSSTTAVYAELNRIYKDEFITTPLMFDLTWCFDKKPVRNGEQALFEEIKKELNVLNKQGALSVSSKKRKLSKSESNTLQMIKKESEKTEKLLLSLQEIEKKELKSLRLSKALALPTDADGFNNQIMQLEKLKNLPGNSQRVLPFLAVDPRRKGIIEYAKQHVGKNMFFAGVKIYTNNGYSPTDPLLFGDENTEGLYAFCEKNKIPITAHCSSVGFVTLANSVFVNGHVWENGKAVMYNNKELKFKYTILQAGKAIKERADYLNNPALWKLVAEKYPRLKVNLAHLGGGKELKKAMESPDDENLWTNKIIELIKDPKYNFYTDISCFGTDDCMALQMLKNSKIYSHIKHKIMYGSDFYLNRLFDDSLAVTLRCIKDIFADDFEWIAKKNPKDFLNYDKIMVQLDTSTTLQK